MAAREQQAWKRFGLMKGEGIPAPSGPYEVGCVDLMHGDSEGQLLVRLFYPTDPGLAGRQYPYSKWLPNPRYMKAYLDFQQIKGSWWKSGLYRMMTEPRIPALYGAPLFTSPEPRPSSQEPHSPSTESPPQDSASPTTEEEPPAQPAAGDSNVEDKTDTPIADATESQGDAKTGSDAPETQTDVEAAEPHTADATPCQAQTDTQTTTSSQPAGSQTTPQPSFPVIVFSHGLGAMRTTYSSICTDLCSHGYVVASVEHTDQSTCIAFRRVPKPNSPAEQFCDDWVEFYRRPPSEPEFPLRNRQVLQRASEVRKALDFLHLLNEGGDSGVVHNMTGERFDWGQFRGRLQLDTAAVMGHSFGGATTIQTLSEDPRFKCGIAFDCWMLPVDPGLLEAGIQQPLVFINSWDFQWRENVLAMMKLVTDSDDVTSTGSGIFLFTGITKCRIMTIRESNHKNQTDVYFVTPKSMIDDISRIDPTLAFSLNQEIVIAFLKRNLLNDPSFQQPMPVLDGGEGASEHIMFGSNVNLEEEKEETNGQIDQASGEEGPLAEIKEGEESVVAFTKDRSSTAIASEEGENRGDDQPNETGEAVQQQTAVQQEVPVEVHVKEEEQPSTTEQNGEEQIAVEKEEQVEEKQPIAEEGQDKEDNKTDIKEQETQKQPATDEIVEHEEPATSNE